MFATKSTSKAKKPQQSWENPIEAWRDLSGAFGQTVKEEGKNFAADALKQIVNLEKDIEKLSGDLKAGDSLDLTQLNKMPQHEPQAPEIDRYVQPGIDYFRQFRSVRERPVVTEDTRQVQVRIDQILVELRNLTSSSQELAVQFEEITMEAAPAQAGTYHLNFFEWVFSVIQKARERIEESQTWLTLFKSKKGQKTYWNMFRKHGTSFGLSGERVVATQTG